MSPLVTSSLQDRRLDLLFKDSSSHNSFSLRAARELRAVLEASAGRFDVLVFRAPGRVFCSGGNLSDYARMSSPDEGRAVNDEISSVLQQIATLPLPTFCLIEGDCFGGGVELLSSFDFVYAVPHAMFGLWQRRIGLTFGWGGGARLRRRLGLSITRQLALTAETFSAERALTLGLIDRVVGSAFINESMEQEVIALRKLPKAPVASIKRWVSKREREVFSSLWWNEEHRARLEAFREKP